MRILRDPDRRFPRFGDGDAAARSACGDFRDVQLKGLPGPAFGGGEPDESPAGSEEQPSAAGGAGRSV